MRISELSKRTGVPVATIKFYLRERLLPPGTPTARNQAVYGEAHLRRLRLIRAFTGIGQLDLTGVRQLLAAIEDDSLPLTELYELVDRALFPLERVPERVEGTQRVRAEVDRFVDDLGWIVDPAAPGRDRLTIVLATLRRLGCDCGIDFFAPYAEAAERLAVHELDLLPSNGSPPGRPERAAAVVRAILLNVAFAATRQMAQEHHAALRFGECPAPAGSG
jgi:DNA-binding transcriptional MerR regulator